jgi:hypothetical protein
MQQVFRFATDNSLRLEKKHKSQTFLTLETLSRTLQFLNKGLLLFAPFLCLLVEKDLCHNLLERSFPYK